MSADDPDPSLDDYDLDEIDVEAIDSFHLTGNRFSASVQLSDKYDESGRSFLIEFELGATDGYDTLLQIEDLILSHVSISPAYHIALEVGGVTHHLRDGIETLGQGPEPFTNRLWHYDAQTILLYGDEGTVCLARGSDWEPIQPVTSAFLRAVHGASRELIYAGGDQGTLIRLAGSSWVSIPLGSNENIFALNISRNGEVFFGCENGFCARVADEELTEIAGPGSQICSICEFRGERYWGDDEYGLYIQKGLELVPFKPLGYGYTMHSTKEFLVVAGWKEVFMFDGSVWSGVEFGYDGDLFIRRLDMTRDYT